MEDDLNQACFTSISGLANSEPLSIDTVAS